MRTPSTLRQKLLLLAGTGILALILAILTGMQGIRSGENSITETGRHRLPAILALQTLKRTLVTQKASTYEVALWEQDADAQAIFARIAKDKQHAAQQASQAWHTYQGIPKTTREEVLWTQFSKALAEWREIDTRLTQALLSLADNHDSTRHQPLFQQFYQLGGQSHAPFQAAEALLDQVIAINAQVVESKTRQAENAARLSARIMVGVGICAIALLLWLDVIIALKILRQLGGEPADAQRLAQRIAQGDFSVELPLRSGDKTSLLASLAHMQKRLRNLLERLRLSEHRFRSLFSNMSEGVALHRLEFDDQGEANGYRILETNERYQTIFGLTHTQLIGKLASDLFDATQTPSLARCQQVVAKQEAASLEIHLERQEKFFAVSIVPWDESGFATIFTDITERKHAESRLLQIAHYDALTQLPNRVLLLDLLAQAMSLAHKNNELLAVCYLDLDDFKPFNDTHGHEIGDRLLIAIARRLQSTLSEQDTVARLGGDEFIILLNQLSTVESGQQTLQHIMATVAQPYEIQGIRASISASAGMTLFPLDDTAPDVLLRHADQAMYRAKQTGRNRIQLFDPEQDRQIIARHAALSELQTALKNEEFCLYYQPKVDMRTHRVIGLEALIRWQHPQRGLLAPGQFLPLLEGSELELDLGDWVLHEALSQLSLWQNEGHPQHVSINVSTRQIEHPNFPRKLQIALECYPHLPAESLELEILESAALEDASTLAHLITEFSAKGVRFSLDDFGTGYSSLSYLKQVPAHTLKIDQSFVRNMLNDPQDEAIVEGVIKLAGIFHRQVIAEGVETAAHGTRLLELGCPLAQGYGIARPMPADQVMEWIKNR